MRSRIEKLSVTETAVLEKASVNHSTWYRWHKGETVPHLAALMRIDEALKELENGK